MDYGIDFKRMPLLCDNGSTVKIANNPAQHSKHIDICHHFLRDNVSKGEIVLSHIRTDDILTRPLDENCFCKFRNELNVIDLSNVS